MGENCVLYSDSRKLGCLWEFIAGDFAFMILMILMMIGRDFESTQAINLNKGQLYHNRTTACQFLTTVKL